MDRTRSAGGSRTTEAPIGRRGPDLFRRLTASVATAVMLVASAAATAQTKAPKGPVFEAGKMTDGTAANGVTWHVRPPKGFDPKAGGIALLLLHGSNMNSAAYVNTVTGAFPKLAEDFVLIGIDGENRVAGSDPKYPACNYSYVNWGGKSKYPGTKAKESPVFVTEALAEIRKSLKLTKVYVGGHSQGGFLAYSLFLNFPDVFAGAFPISAGLIVQCEPDAFEDAAVRTAQRRGAIAIVHAKDDPVVSFSSGDNAWWSFLNDRFPALKLVAPERGAHMFGLLPIEDAVRWLVASTEDDPKKAAAELAKSVEAKAWRDVAARSARLKSIDTKLAHRGAIESANKALETAAAAAVKAIRPAFTDGKDGVWLEAFTQFRNDFEFAAAAQPLLDVYAARREAQAKAAEKHWQDARAAWNANKAPAAEDLCRKILRECPASIHARYALNALRK